MRSYTQLSQAQRYQIGILKEAGKNQKQIAELLGPSAGTICRELQRNTGKRGLPSETGPNKGGHAQETSRQSREKTATAIALIEAKIVLDWSPEQVAGWLAAERSEAHRLRLIQSIVGYIPTLAVI